MVSVLELSFDILTCRVSRNGPLVFVELKLEAQRTEDAVFGPGVPHAKPRDFMLLGMGEQDILDLFRNSVFITVGHWKGTSMQKE